jgi:hypothetical protein
MTDTPTAIEVDCSTGIATERPLTAEEIANAAALAAQAEANAAAKEAADKAKADAKAAALAKLQALGLTADEVAAIL